MAGADDASAVFDGSGATNEDDWVFVGTAETWDTAAFASDPL
jgi:hypothetical protein